MTDDSKSAEDLIAENEALKEELAKLKFNSGLVLKKDHRKEIARERQLLADFAIGISRGQTRDEIISELGITSNTYDILHTKYFTQVDKEQEGKSSLRIFSEYVTSQDELIRTLWKFTDSSSKDSEYRNAQAFVAAVRAQSDIRDRIIKMGQELGVIVRTPEKILVIDGADARDMDTNELRHQAIAKIRKVEKMLEESKRKKVKAKVIQFRSKEEQQEAG
jgi:hypothetical protein